MADSKDQSAIAEGSANNVKPALSPEPSALCFEDLKAKLQSGERAHVESAGLDTEKLKVVQERLYKMIEYTVRRQDWYSDQCHRLLQIGLALIAAGAALLALFAKLENLSPITQVLAWALPGSLVFTGIALVFLFNRTLDGDYPYRKVADISSWYFAYRFPLALRSRLSRNHDAARDEVSKQADYIQRYFATFLAHASDQLNLIREDIEQVAILLILQRYRSQQTRQMSRLLLIGLSISVLLMVAFGVSYSVSTRKPLTPVPSSQPLPTSAVGSPTPTATPVPATTTPTATPVPATAPPTSKKSTPKDP
jgi:hypothetical protein